MPSPVQPGPHVIEFHGGGTLLVNQANNIPVLIRELASSSLSFPSLMFRKHSLAAIGSFVTGSAIGSLVVGFTIVGSTKEFSVA